MQHTAGVAGGAPRPSPPVASFQLPTPQNLGIVTHTSHPCNPRSPLPPLPQGEATAALAAFAFANRTRPPEHPLADPTAFLSNPQSRFQDLVAHTKLRCRGLRVRVLG